MPTSMVRLPSPYNASLQGTLTAYAHIHHDEVGHVPRVISNFFQYFSNYGGLLKGRVRNVRYRISLIPKGGLEITVTIVVIKHQASPAMFNKMNELIFKYYTYTN